MHKTSYGGNHVGDSDSNIILTDCCHCMDSVDAANIDFNVLIDRGSIFCAFAPGYPGFGKQSIQWSHYGQARARRDCPPERRVV